MKIVTDRQYEEHDCPGCGAKLKIEKEPPTITMSAAHDDNAVVLQKLEALESKINAKPVIEEKPKKEEIILQSHVPGYRCGPDCQKIHRNKGYKSKVKGKCNTCDQFSNVDKGACPWCEDGEIEKIEEEELEDLKIRKPDVHEHGDE